MKRLVVVDRSVRFVFHAVVMVSIYLLFAGHNQPGGGFVGGLVAGAALALRYIAGGIDEVRGLSRVPPWTILGSGLLLAVGTAIAPLLSGEPVLTAMVLARELPVLGALKVTSALPFDTGVYLVVVGLVLMTFEAFGEDQLPPSPESRR